METTPGKSPVSYEIKTLYFFIEQGLFVIFSTLLLFLYFQVFHKENNTIKSFEASLARKKLYAERELTKIDINKMFDCLTKKLESMESKQKHQIQQQQLLKQHLHDQHKLINEQHQLIELQLQQQHYVLHQLEKQLTNQQQHQPQQQQPQQQQPQPQQQHQTEEEQLVPFLFTAYLDESETFPSFDMTS